MTAEQGAVNEEASSDPETRHAQANAQQVSYLREALAGRSVTATPGARDVPAPEGDTPHA